METAYLNYIATDWKREQEELKKDGQSLSYKVLRTEGHGPTDWNLMLMTEYKDMATMEANVAKEDALVQRVIGNDEKQRQGYRERLEIREVLADRLAREIVLEPKAINVWRIQELNRPSRLLQGGGNDDLSRIYYLSSTI